MTRIRKFTLAIMAVLVGLAVSPALAAPNAYARQASNIYKKASSNSAVVNHVNANQLVTVLDCKGNYCLLQLPGPDGWIKQNRLGSMKQGKPASNAPFNFSFGIGGDGKPSISIGVGNQPSVEPDEDPQVCFYKSSNYGGSSLCVEPGDSDDSLSGSWDDNISSIEVMGGAEVMVCTEEDLEGICANISSSKKTLPGALNNEISSYEVN